VIKFLEARDEALDQPFVPHLGLGRHSQIVPYPPGAGADTRLSVCVSRNPALEDLKAEIPLRSQTAASGSPRQLVGGRPAAPNFRRVTGPWTGLNYV
jgi:hypothetical protein